MRWLRGDRGPDIFHLIRRQPRGQSEFSSLMFLSPRRPRSRGAVDWTICLLLLLRALHWGLLLFAFARPF